MSEFNRSDTLSSTSGFVLNQQPDADRRVALVRIEGTFVGTLKIQGSSDNVTWNDLTVTNIESAAQANPTAPGNYAASLGASDTMFRVIFSAYTSGSARVKTAAVRFI